MSVTDHDRKRVPDPGTLDISSSDDKHLAFGRDIHYCLGTPLAGMVGQIAIDTLLRRMTYLRLKGSPA